MSVDIRVLTPANGLEEHIGDIARLRVSVFRDWPYIYEGTDASEREYLAGFMSSKRAVCVSAFDGDQMVGASTGLPIDDEPDEIRAPFAKNSIDTSAIFYAAESVLLPAYRGQGIYRSFMSEREAFAKNLGGFQSIVFCGVIRPDDHPLKPRHAEPLDNVWRHFGYAPCHGLECTMSWLDRGDTEETVKSLRFWEKSL